MNAALNKQSYRPLLAMSALQILLEPHDPSHPQAWRIDNQLLISEPALNAKLLAAESPAPVWGGTLVEYLRILGLINHCERFVLTHDAQSGSQGCWVPIVTIEIDELGVGQILGDIPTWALREVQDHPYMAMINLPGRENCPLQEKPWRLDVLFSSKALLASTQALIATQHAVKPLKRPQEHSQCCACHVRPTNQALLAAHPDLSNPEALKIAGMDDSLELSSEKLRAILIGAVTNCLDKAYSDRGVAWRVNNNLLISESSLLYQLSAQAKRLLGSEVKPDPAPFDRLLTLNLIKRTHSYFLTIDARFEISKWRSLAVIDIDALDIASALNDTPSWILHDVEALPFMAEENHEGKDATRHQASRWDLVLLLRADARRSEQLRPSTALPTPHVVIVTYHGTPSHGLPSARMTTSNLEQPTHWCGNCNRHFQFNQVRVIRPAPDQPEGEVELLVCPCCDSYDIEVMQEAHHV